jgi:DNA-binding response OmpR family regulator/EAL domain-containing protein (putative c-di-GMP-specific phosphodiesterase class I)
MSQISDNQDEIEKQFADYANRLPETVNEINESWLKLCDIRWDKKTFSRLYTAVHKLAGTAGNFGFDKIGHLTHMLDQVFRTIEETGLPDKAGKQKIKTWIEELRLLANKPADSAAMLNLPQNRTSNTKDLIYIVDDDDNASNYFAIILRSAGYVIEVYSNLADFNRALEQKKPDIIIMDIVFPEGKLAGIDAINQLEAEMGESIPIIFISQRSDIHTRIHALRAGGCTYITKPVKPETMLSVVASKSTVEQKHRRILVIDDDPVTLSYLETLMKTNHYEVLCSADPVETLQLIESFLPDIVVMDYHMPDYNGDELLKMLRQDQRYANLPVIMVTADNDPEVEKKISQLAHTRFFSKPFNNELFIESISESIEAAYHSQNRTLDLLEQHPPGLLNLFNFYSELESIIATSASSEQQSTLLYFAIDDPVAIRERMGLKRLVNLNKKISSYLLSLIGNNELISQLTESVYLVLIQTDEQSTLETRLDCLKNMIESKAFTVDHISITVTASIGAISITPEINSVDEAVSMAESASIDASKGGGNQICIRLTEHADIDKPDSDTGRAFIEAFEAEDLHLQLQYQPIININTSESFYEAYTRFVADEKTITPKQFMPYLKQYKLEFEFNKRIIISAIHDIVKPDSDSNDQKKTVVIIKLEPTHETMVKFLDWFEEYLDTNQIEIQHKLIFSFRESWVLKNHDDFSRFMKQAQKHNYELALEHVGLSKYSADLIGTIKPVYAKLAPDFIELLLSTNRETSKASRTVLRKLKATNSHMVASSVENTDTFAKLMSLGIQYFQGYIVQHPEGSFNFAPSVSISSNKIVS